MKKSLSLFYILIPFIAFSQAGEWTWMKGDSAGNSKGNYGVQGIPSPTNEPPARYASGQWTDLAGNFWIYGGVNYKGDDFSDLWKFDPLTNCWTWMMGDTSTSFGVTLIKAGKGIYSPLNAPGDHGHGMFTWTTSDNHLWLFGGDRNGLWQYNPAINQWAYMGSGLVKYGVKGIGDTTTCPGERGESTAAWVDSVGNLWLFGGFIYYVQPSFYELNDMWKYDVTSGIWTWMSGSPNQNDKGIYGTVNVPSVNNYPAARSTNLFWKDDHGNFWLSGGSQFSTGSSYQDVWKFNPKTLEWTWIGGSKDPDSSSAKGLPCKIDSLNKEGACYENRAVWKICDEMILNYGGGTPHIQPNGLPFLSWAQNDFWAYLPTQNKWVKIASTNDLNGNYGSKGVSKSTNFPPARFGEMGFKDKKRNIWMFGGLTFSNNGSRESNDLWMYVLDTTCLGNLCGNNCNLASPIITANRNNICSNDSAQICAPSGFSSYQWNASGSSKCIEAKQAGNYYVTVSDANNCTAESNHISIIVHPVPSVSIVVQGDTFSSYNAVSYQWYKDGFPISMATSPVYIAHGYGAYALAITDSNGCAALSNPINYTGIEDIGGEHVWLYPNPSTGLLFISVSGFQPKWLSVYDINGRKVKEEKFVQQVDVSGLTAGIYFIELKGAEGVGRRRFVKE